MSLTKLREKPPVTPPRHIGYCTNVHPGTDLPTIKERLDRFASPIAAKLEGGQELGVGLWLPNEAAQALSLGDAATDFASWLRDRRLFPFTINGFPYGNFHSPVVKHAVYLPTWASQQRLEYTCRLAHIMGRMHSCLRREPVGQSREVDDSDQEAIASISTLPLGWPSDDDQAIVAASGRNLRELSKELQRIESSLGIRVIVAIEPEPGCILDRSEDIVRFFERELPDTNHRRYLGVCHDVCHSSVMFEDQAYVLGSYAKAGITVGKVQVSSAIDLPLAVLTADEQASAVEQLAGFAEDRYLHQTGCLDTQGHFSLVEDLPDWIRDWKSSRDSRSADAHIRVHFHVPIFLERFGHLQTTRAEILRCIDALSSSSAPDFSQHWEVETYAWSVMPEKYRTRGLEDDLARELSWLKGLLQ